MLYVCLWLPQANVHSEFRGGDRPVRVKARSGRPGYKNWLAQTAQSSVSLIAQNNLFAFWLFNSRRPSAYFMTGFVPSNEAQTPPFGKLWWATISRHNIESYLAGKNELKQRSMAITNNTVLFISSHLGKSYLEII